MKLLDLNDEERAARAGHLALAIDEHVQEVLVGLSREESEWLVRYRSQWLLRRRVAGKASAEEVRRAKTLGDLHETARLHVLGIAKAPRNFD